MTFRSNVPAVRKALDDALVEGMVASTLGASRLIRKTLSQPGTGRIYRISKGRKSGRNLRAKGFHQASAAGRPPAVNTNRLRQSWTVSQVGGKGLSGNADLDAMIRQYPDRVVLEYGSRVPYASMLEYGTNRMKARPYVKPTIPYIASIVPKLFKAAIQRRLRK
jgi:hypothetical protein